MLGMLWNNHSWVIHTFDVKQDVIYRRICLLNHELIPLQTDQISQKVFLMFIEYKHGMNCRQKLTSIQVFHQQIRVGVASLGWC